MSHNGFPDTARQVRVVVVDDHPVVRAGLRALLDGSAELSVVGDAADATESEKVVAAAVPDVVLMDLNLGPGMDGIDAIGLLQALPRPPRVVVLSTYDTEADVNAALDAIAAGFLLKDSPPDDLIRSVIAAARGETVLAPQITAALVRRVSGAVPVLTAREIEILNLLSAGASNRDVAKALFISEATVKSHLTNIYGKLGVESRAGAVSKAIERHIIRPGG
jgi:DNA-binding NarL/FixJ family response regulator